jgi:hypothetical protein
MTIPFLAGSLITVFALFGGHYAFQKPRLQLQAPWSYVYGVSAVLLGAVTMALLLGTWALHLGYVAALFAVGGLVVFVLYQIDKGIEARHTAADLAERLDAELRRRTKIVPGYEEELL